MTWQLDQPLVLALVIISVVAMLMAWLRRNRTPRLAAGLWAGAWWSLLAVLGHGLLLRAQATALGAGDYNNSRWVFLTPWGRPGFVIVAVIGCLTLWLAWRSTRALSSLRRGTLVALRGVVVGLALIFWVQPALELRQVARERNTVAVLVDASDSMNVRESPATPTPWQQALALVESGVLENWRRERDVEVFSFATMLRPAPLPNGPSGPSQLYEALEQLRRQFTTKDLAGVVLLSDGAATGEFGNGARTPLQQEFLRTLGAPVFTVWTAAPNLRDLAVTQVATDEFAFARTVMNVEAVLVLTGYPAQTVTVELRSEGKLLATQVATVTADRPRRVAFEVTPERIGRFVYEVKVVPLADESVLQNNSYPFVVRVLRDKIRVLHVAGNPSWDMRAMRQMLKANPNVDLISFYVLRTQDDIADVPQEEMSLIQFPTAELFDQELPSFDLVILQDFAYAPYGIGPYLPAIRSYVERGGALALVGGPTTFRTAGYQNTVLDPLLPFDLGAGELVDVARFRPTLTKAGLAHPATALRFRATSNVSVWKNLPLLEGVNRVGDVRRGATVLATHPTLRTATGKPMPVIAITEFGEGRVLALTTDSLWRWGFVPAGAGAGDGRAYDRFWEGAMRWLVRDPELQILRLNADADKYSTHDVVRTNVRLVDADYAPLASEVEVTLSGGESTAQRTITTNAAGEGVVEWRDLASGVYRVEARAKVAGQRVVAADVLVIEASGQELRKPQGDEATLRDLAAATGGTHLGAVSKLPNDLSFREPRMVRVDQRRDLAWWSWPGLLVAAVLALAAEWLLRQRYGYL